MKTGSNKRRLRSAHEAESTHGIVEDLHVYIDGPLPRYAIGDAEFGPPELVPLPLLQRPLRVFGAVELHESEVLRVPVLQGDLQKVRADPISGLAGVRSESCSFDAFDPPTPILFPFTSAIDPLLRIG